MLLGMTANAEQVTYGLTQGETHAAGSTVDVTYNDEVVATVTYGFEGGADFTAPKANSAFPGSYGYTEGNGANGAADSGTTYIINPKYDGTIGVAVVLNASKAFYVLEDGVALPEYDGIKEEAKVTGKVYSFDVTGGKEYKVYCTGSKLGFYGFNYEFTIPANPEPESGSFEAGVKMTYIDGSDDYVNDSYGPIAEGEVSKAGYNKISGGSVELVNKGWGCNWITYLQVDASAAQGNIVKATLTFDASGSTDNKRTTGWGVGYNNSEWDADMTWLTADRSITTMGDVKWTTSKALSTFNSLEFDITEALLKSEGNVATILVYETAAAGGHMKNPVVTVEWSNAATYNVTFTETAGVAATVKVDGNDVTKGVTLTDGTYAYTASATGYYNYEGEFTVAGADLNVEFTMEAKPVWKYTVNGVDAEGNVLAQVAAGEGFAEDGVTYHYPGFIFNEGVLYATAKKSVNPWYGVEGALLDEDGKVFTQTYGSTIADAVFYKEAEEMEGFNSQDTNNAPIRCSNGLGGNVVDGTEVVLTTLPAGTYKITGQVWGTTGLTAGVKIMSEEIDEDGNPIAKDLWTLATTGSLVNSTSDEFTLTEKTDLYVYTTGGTDKRMLDFIYITGTPAAVETYTVTFNVADEAGAAVEGAWVYFNDQEYETSAEGTVVVEGEDWGGKTFYYTVMKDYSFVEGEVTIESTETVVNVVLETPMCTAKITVLDVEGEPLEGAIIKIEDTEVVTNANGMATIEGNWIGTLVSYTVALDGYKTMEGVLDFTESMEYWGVVTMEKDIEDGVGMMLQNGNADIYDLQGRKVKNPAAGIYVVNGKKVVIVNK